MRNIHWAILVAAIAALNLSGNDEALALAKQPGFSDGECVICTVTLGSPDQTCEPAAAGSVMCLGDENGECVGWGTCPVESRGFQFR